MASSVSVYLPSHGVAYTFSGVISVQHEFSLKLQTDSESVTGSDYLNGARNQPDKVVLSVAESDVGHMSGWAARMMQAMESVKRTRTLCNVVTSAFVYSGMLLSEFTATEDETSQSGWQGTLTFIRSVTSSGTTKRNDNSSRATHTGSAGSVGAITAAELEQMLARSAVYLG